MRLPFRYLEPTFFAGLFDDPLLYLKLRPLGRGLLVDCGQMHHLAKRVIRSLDVVFVSHAHMDHFMGIETLTRGIHVAPRTIDLFGPPGIAEKLWHKLSAYDWNLAEPYWGSYRVHECQDGTLTSYLLPGPERFARRHLETKPLADGMLYRNRYVSVRGCLCDHRIPVLALRIEESESFQIDAAKLAARGLVPGGWLRELNRRFAAGNLAKGPLRVTKRTAGVLGEELVADAAGLYRQLRAETPPASIGYLTDVGLTGENLERIRSLLGGVSLLVCECTYLAAEQERARRSYHLCSSDLNQLLAMLKPRFVLPMHLSKNYLRRPEALYAELALPAGTTLLRLPPHVTPRPLLPAEIGWLSDSADRPG